MVARPSAKLPEAFLNTLFNKLFRYPNPPAAAVRMTCITSARKEAR